MTNYPNRIAIIGSGPSGLYLLQNVLASVDILVQDIDEITVFEREDELGVGMPYRRKTTDRYNICNISSEEIPRLDLPFADWLQSLDETSRCTFGVLDESISPKETYPRIALGGYFRSQWIAICGKLQAAGIRIVEKPLQPVADIEDDPCREAVWLVTEQGERFEFDRVIVATGHRWSECDRPDEGFFASPWPIQKLLPGDNDFFSFSIGTLGASLSAFDVVTSLAHRHGRFVEDGDGLRFEPHPNAGQFKLVMHSADGWLPHLQYEQREPFREIYRHVSRDGLLSLQDEQGFLRLENYFDKVCRPALVNAFTRDQRTDMVEKLKNPMFDLQALVEQLTSEHQYSDAFAGMRKEMPRAEASIGDDRPIHWKEVLDDLMYTLNFHAELMPAEDHLRFRSVVMPFLMNVIAALPLDSARTLLALHDAGRLELVEGYVEIRESEDGQTVVEVDCDGGKSVHRYKIFVDCSGQQAVEIEEYPFESLVTRGTVRASRAKFASQSSLAMLAPEQHERVINSEDGFAVRLGGIDIDASFRVIGADAIANPRIHEIAFPHTTGLRPYSYGLQACNDTAEIVVRSWLGPLRRG